MKRTLLLTAFCLIASFSLKGQWSNSGNNLTTGTLRVGPGIPYTTKQFFVRADNSDHVAVFENINSFGNGVIISAKEDPLRVGSLGNGFGNLMIIKGDGRVGIGTTSPLAGYKLNVAGSAYISSTLEAYNVEANQSFGTVSGHTGDFNDVYYNNLYNMSDRNFKKEIEEDYDSYKDLYSVKTYSYKYKNDASEKQQYGVMAQDMQTIYPELVSDRGEKGLAVNYTAMIPMLIRAVQDQKQTIDMLQNELSALKSELAKNPEVNDLMKVEEDRMVIYPNPATNVTKISFKNHGEKDVSARVEVVNLNGETLQTANVGGKSSLEVDTSGLRKGVYFVRYFAEGKLTETKRILIEK